MYEKSARFYDWIYTRKDYESDAATLLGHIRQRAPRATSLLDVACGTGRHLESLREQLEVAGVDASEQMLEVARERLGDVRLVHGDMRSFNLGRRFDVVMCLFGSIALLKSLDEARKAVANMVRHLVPRGLLVIEPWVAEDAWEDGRVDAAAHEFPEGQIAIASSSKRVDDVAQLDMQYLVATREGVEHISEPLEAGVWTEQDYKSLVADHGLETYYDDYGLMGRGLVIGVTPG